MTWLSLLLISACLLGGCSKKRAPQQPETPTGEQQNKVQRHPAAQAIGVLFRAARDNDLAKFKGLFTKGSHALLDNLLSVSAKGLKTRALTWQDLMRIHQEIAEPRIVSVVSTATTAAITLGHGRTQNEVQLQLVGKRWLVDLTAQRDAGALKTMTRKLQRGK